MMGGGCISRRKRLIGEGSGLRSDKNNMTNRGWIGSNISTVILRGLPEEFFMVVIYFRKNFRIIYLRVKLQAIWSIGMCWFMIRRRRFLWQSGRRMNRTKIF